MLACIVGEAVREGGSKSSKLSGAGGGRLFRDLDLLAEYMFSSSAYTADSLYGGNVQRDKNKISCPSFKLTAANIGEFYRDTGFFLMKMARYIH